MWAPPLIEQAPHSPGNLDRVYQYFRDPRALPDVVDGYRVVAGQFGLTPEWLTGRRLCPAVAASG